VQRNDADGFIYRVKAGTTSRAVEAHRTHLRTKPEDTVVLVSDGGQVWWGMVGRLPRSASFSELGLGKGEQVVAAGVLSASSFLILGTVQGQVKRVRAEDVTSTAEASWASIIGLEGEDDRVLFAGVGGDKADVMFLTSSRANRFAAASVNPQATPSARGVAAIKLRKGDQLLAGAVLDKPAANMGVVVVSKTGYLKRVPMDEFPVQGRGGQGVLVLNQTQATGPIVAATVGRMKGAVDLITADGKRQRVTDVPEEKRANRGKKLVKVSNVAEVWVP
jgi:DNA gyrase subunit A